MNCLVCNNPNAELAFKNYPGYINETYYDIFNCHVCDTSFMDISNYDKDIYEKIYEITKNNPESILGYDRYSRYASKIKSSKNPLRYLMENEDTYFAIFSFLKNKPTLKILEIGCGLGYLTYALKKSGNDVTGIDISQEAINFAKDNFGDFFLNCNIIENQLLEPNSFDLIIGTELIEHIPNIRDFIEKCKFLLKDGGSMIFTTPNKDFFKDQEVYWLTDNPPVHTVWLSKNSFRHLANDFNLNLVFLNSFNDFAKYNILFSNLLTYLKVKIDKNKKPNSILGMKTQTSILKRIIVFNMNIPFIYKICNYFSKFIFKESGSLFVVLEK